MNSVVNSQIIDILPSRWHQPQNGTKVLGGMVVMVSPVMWVTINPPIMPQVFVRFPQVIIITATMVTTTLVTIDLVEILHAFGVLGIPKLQMFMHPVLYWKTPTPMCSAKANAKERVVPFAVSAIECQVDCNPSKKAASRIRLGSRRSRIH